MQPLLFLCHRVPVPPNKGEKIRAYHLLKRLAARHRVFLGTFLDDPADRPHLSELRDLCAEAKVVELRRGVARLRTVTGLLRREPLTLPYYRSEELAKWVRSVVAREGIEKALIFSSGMAQYLLHVPQIASAIDFVDVDSAKWSEYAARRAWPLSALYRREGQRLLQFERRMAARALAASFVTQEEAALFRRLAPECADKIIVVPNGVDSEYFSPVHALASPYPAGSRPLVFTGAMDYWPNVDAVCWFVREVFPLVRKQAPDVCFHTVGMNPSSAVRKLASDSVVVTGRVADVRPYLRHAAVAVAPLRVGRGLQNKVLEAMAMARPVVASRAAATGLAVRPGAEIEVADTAPDFARCVLALLDAASGNALGAAARKRVVSAYDWDANLAPLQRLLAEPHAIGASGPQRHVSPPQP
jgi:sugar transferase (PEP-CTERM/EpsH1 system associated)